jgi:hypothetical protein
MQRIIPASLIAVSVIFLSLESAAAIPTKASAAFVKEQLVATNIKTENISPFELTYRAYQGRYKAQGISSFGSFKQDARTGEVNPVKLVAAAIAAGELSPKIANDQKYLSALESQLWRIARS